PQPPQSATPTGESWYEVYFTDPAGADEGTPRSGGVDERLVALMDRATRSLDVAVYEFDLRNVAEAMARARNRGVVVRMVTDTDTLTSPDEATQAALAIVQQAGIPIEHDGRSDIMHHKFTVV